MDPACSSRQCLRFRICAGCGVRFETDDGERWYCEKCMPSEDETWRAFK